MANTIRTALVIDLEGNVVGEIRKMDQALDGAGDAADKTGGRFKRFFTSLTSGLQKASASLKRVGEGMTNIGQQMSLKVTAPVTAMGAGILKTAGDFEAGMNRVAAVSGASAEEITALTNQAKELGRTTKFSASEAADAMGFLAMAGNDANEIMSAMPATLQLAAAAGVDLGSAADTVTNILAGFRLETDELARANDVLVSAMTGSNTDLVQLGEALKYAGPVASSFGLTLEETTAALGMLGNAGIQASMAGTTLRGMLTRLANPSKDAAGILEDLGIAAFNADGSLKPLADILGQVERSGMDSAQAMEVFGQRAGPGVLALVGQGTQALTDLQTRLEGAGGTAQRISEVQMKGFNGAMKSFASAMEGLGLAIASSGLLETATGLVTQFTDWIRVLAETNPELLNLGVVVAGAAAAIGPIALVLGGVVTALGALLSPIGLVVAAVGGLAAAWIAFGDDIKQLASQVVQWIGDMGTRAVAAVRTMVENIGGYFTELAGGIKSWFADKLPDWMVRPFQRATEQVTEAGEQMTRDAIGNSWVPDMIEGVRDWFGRLGEWMVTPMREAGEEVTDIGETTADSVTGFFEDMGRRIGGTFRDILSGAVSFKDGLKRIISDIGDMIQTRLVDATVDGLFGLLPGGVREFLGVGGGGHGFGGYINGGGFGGAIGQGTGSGSGGGGLLAGLKGMFKSGEGFFSSLKTGLGKLFGSSATAAGNLGFKGPAAFATQAAGSSSSFLGLSGLAIPGAILGGTLVGTSILASRDAKKIARARETMFSNFSLGNNAMLGSGSTFIGSLETGVESVQKMYVAVNDQLNRALKETGTISGSLNLQLQENGQTVRQLVGDADAVRTALDNAKVTGFQFAGSLETAIEKGGSLRVNIQGDAEAIKSALQDAAATGVGSFRDLEVTGSGVSATLTGDFARWNKLLQEFVTGAVHAAVSGVNALGSEAGRATSNFLELASAARSAARAASSYRGGRAAQVDTGYAFGGVSRGAQLAWVSEGPYPVEAHIPMVNGHDIPVRLSGGVPTPPASVDLAPVVAELRAVRTDLDRVVGRPITRTIDRARRRAAATERRR